MVVATEADDAFVTALVAAGCVADVIAWPLVDGGMAWPAAGAAPGVVAVNAEAPSVYTPGPAALASRTDGSTPRPATPAKALR